MKKAEIKLTIELDDNIVPENILRESTDSENKDALAVKSMILAVWDHHFRTSLRTDLWRTHMPGDEMQRFFYETVQTMAASFLRATGEEAIAGDLRDDCAHFAEKMELTEGK